jgi:hypothetical protein
VAARPLTTLAGIRLAVGVGAYATPNFAAKLFGLDPVANPQASYLGRLFGVRDVALAAGTLGADEQSRKLWVRLGVLCDVADIGASVLAVRNGSVSKLTGVLAGGTALGATVLGVLALNADA